MSEPMWNEKQVSENYGIPVSTLQKWRRTNKHLPFHRIGRLVRYFPSEVEAAVKEGTS